MKNKLYLILAGVVFLIVVYYSGKYAGRKNAEITRAKSEIKLHESRAKLFKDSLLIKERLIKLLTSKVEILAHENDSLSKRETVYVTRIIHTAVIPYKATEADSVLRKRYKY